MISKDLKDADDLDAFLEGLHEGDSQKNRLLVVLDLSTRMIEKLGSTFDIEPGFFRSHIGDYVWLNTRDPQAEIPDLEASSAKSNYFNAQYVSPRYFENQDQLKLAKAQVESFNVQRRIDHDGRFKEWSDLPGSEVGLVRCKVSLWVRPNGGANQGWLGKLCTTRVEVFTDKRNQGSCSWIRLLITAFHSGLDMETFIQLQASTHLLKIYHSLHTAAQSKSSYIGH